jgi:hypothetical protein
VLASAAGADRLQVLGDALAAANSVVEDDQRATLLCDLLTVLPSESALGACCPIFKTSMATSLAMSTWKRAFRAPEIAVMLMLSPGWSW